jgi:competence protein ComEC
MVLWFKKPSYVKLIAVLVLFLLFQAIYFGSIWNIQTQKELIVFNVKKSSLIGERDGQNITLFYKDSLPKNTMLKSYLTANFSKIKNQKRIQNLLFFKNNKILILDSLGIYPLNIKPNVLIITQSPKINLDRLLQQFRPKQIIADDSNFKTYIKVWKTTCNKQKIPFHATGEKGFYRFKK